ncbi:MAG: hypothetical protein DRG11_05190 [Epsilonproteobacteria bacterium]|nr:MAG: hypothetical protein DRG11_05190 [Campylobacterota bacterium]
MFQISILKNFVKSYSSPPNEKIDTIHKLVTKPYIAEDANGAEYITLLSQLLNWSNISREVKNTTDMKKADGVVYDKHDNPIAIIELKSSDKNISNTDTIAQAFRYKNEKPTCKVVIISNFKQLDIYSDSSDKCFRFDMTDRQNYKTLYALLCQSSLDTGHISRLKAISKSQEQITKEVYRLYSSFRLQLINNLIANNPNQTKEQLLAHSVKLLDRYMFVLFAEDRGLIPANSIDKIIAQYETAKDGWDEARPLYYYYKKYFEFIDIGNPSLDIPRYNGNLFKPDVELDNLNIDDSIIKEDLSKLSAYDFSDDVDVEVLGHIFEQSLNDLEQIKESLIATHTVVDTRKKDGVYYTPKFITRYIIEHTIGTLCYERKLSLDLLQPMSDTATKKQKQTKLANLKLYKSYIENLKIVDPACGSGAFLNMAYRYLLEEHQYIQTLQAKAGAGLLDMHHIDKSIIENNLYGVDINTASVGIAKLSLWLQTAKRDRPLSDLMHNIICANSLTANWSELFPQIMADGGFTKETSAKPTASAGFDVVIGNPPYGAAFSTEDKNNLKEIYKTIHKGKFDSYYYFIKRGVDILKQDGLLGYIVPDTWTSLQQTEKLRKFILDNNILALEKYNFKVFEDANVDTISIIIEKANKLNEKINITIVNKDFEKQAKQVSQNRFLKNDSYIFNYQISENDVNILSKIKKDKLQIKDFCEWSQGLIPYDKYTGMSKDMIKNRVYHSDYKKDKTYKEELAGKDISKYDLQWNGNNWISYGDWLASPRKQKFFTSPRILVQRIRNPRLKIRIVATYTEEEYYNNPALSNFISLENSNIDLKFILAILNSKMINWIYTKSFTDVNIKPTDLEKLPIPDISKEKQKPFIDLVDTIIDTKEKTRKYNKHFDSLNAVQRIEIQEEIEKLEGLVLSSIDEIDSLVYGLYGLSSDEVKIVEGK